MTVLYFTATGNSLYIAKQFDCETVSIPQAIKENRYGFKDDVIGVICPVYCNKPPRIVLDFLSEAKLDAEYKFMVLTYGHANFGTAKLTSEICKGQGFDYIQTLLTVDNYLPVFDMNKETAIDKKVDKQFAKIKADVLSRKRYVPKRKIFDRFMGRLFERYFKSHPELNDGSQITVTENCIGCGICVEVCPIGNFYLENGVAKRKKETCEFCLACANLCTNKAIICKLSDRNPNARYRNPMVELSEIIKSNSQTTVDNEKGIGENL